ncbi:MAG: LicD family protein [Ruminococcus sp.]|nr:LicD family protein [Ruminococcus sp.]
MLNKFQQTELNVLKEVIKICNKHDLKYYAIGGTCIGAVRHNGFIPWDDDIDIAMPRKDYERFRNKYYKELPKKYKLLDCDNSKSNTFVFSKVHDSTTTMIDKYAVGSPDRFTGAFVDIMPVDGLPDNYREATKLAGKIQLLLQLNILRRQKMRSIDGHYIILKKILKPFVNLFSNYNTFSNLIYKKMSKYKYGSSKYVLFTWRPNKSRPLHRRVFKYSFFKDTIEWPFEDIMIRIPAKYDDYLKQDFGDYMKLPDENNRNSGHDAFIYDMDKPCSYYAKKDREGTLSALLTEGVSHNND